MEFSPSITFLVPQTVAVKRVLVVSDHTYAYTWLILAVYEKPHVRLHLVNAYSL